MKKYMLVICFLCIFSLITGCGGGGSSDSGGSTTIENISGTWIGAVVAKEVADTTNSFTMGMTMTMAQTGTTVTGTFNITELFPITAGTLESFSRSADSLGGILDDGGAVWTSVSVVSGSITGSTITLSGTVDWPGLFTTDLVSFVITVNLSV